MATSVPLALLVVALASRESSTTRAVKSPLVGKPAPSIEAESIDGQGFRLSAFRGKWVVVNFFATWCVDGGIAVAPQRFGDYGGDLIGVDEHTGEVVFIRADATSGVVASTGLPIGPGIGARSLGFVPEGFDRRGGSAYVADSTDARPNASEGHANGDDHGVTGPPNAQPSLALGAE